MITYRSNGSVKRSPSSHNHESNIVAVEALKTVEAIKTDEVTSSGIQHSMATISIPAALKIPSKESLSKIVRRKRKISEVDFSGSVHTTRGEP